MLIMSDPQIDWWRSGADPTCKNEDKPFPGVNCVKSKGRTTNLDMVNAMNRVTELGMWPLSLEYGAGNSVNSPRGVIINGDLTEAWHAEQREDFLDYYQGNASINYPGLDYIFYPGLGNHDYANYVNDCRFSGVPADSNGPITLPFTPSNAGDFNGCAKDAVLWLKKYVEELHNNVQPISFDLTETNPFRSAKVYKWNVLNPDAFTESTTTDTKKKHFQGSVSYSFDVGNYHFVQLNNYPGYAVTLPEVQLWVETTSNIDKLCPRMVTEDIYEDVFNLAGIKIGTKFVKTVSKTVYDVCGTITNITTVKKGLHYPGISIAPSWDWLLADLTAATARGQYSVINLHDINDHGRIFNDGNFLNTLVDQNVIAIFGGHIHQDFGYLKTIETINSGGRYPIQVFLGGAAECDTFLLVDFQARYFNVGVVDTNFGSPRLMLNKEVCDSRGLTGTHANDVGKINTFEGNNYGANNANSEPKSFVLNRPPTVSFSVSTYEENEGTTINFDAVGTDPDGDPLKYTWDFGDGVTASGQHVSHAYAEGGEHSTYYQATAYVADNYGGQGNKTAEVRIFNVKPTITSIAGSINNENDEAEVRIVHAVQSNATTLDVDYGDGNIAYNIGSSITHTYTNAGTYYVCVTVTEADSSGNILCTDSYCDSVTVTSGTMPCQADFCFLSFSDAFDT